jgi:predicted PurR-regulated permease PerM
MPTDVRSIALTVLAVIAVVLVLQFAQSVLIPIVLGMLISYALDPIVNFLVRWRVPRAVAAAGLLLALTGVAVWMVFGLRTQAIAVLDDLPQAARHVRERIERDRPRPASAIEQVQKAATELERAASSAQPQTAPGVQRVQIESPPFQITDYLMSGSLGVAMAIGQLTLILFLVYFLLASGDLYRRKLVKIAGPSLTKKKVTLQILGEIDRQIERFLLVQVFTSAIVAVATWLAFRWLGLHQAGVWGLAAGIFNSIPYLGPVVVTGTTMALALLQFGSFEMALAVGGVALAITSLEGLLLTPWLTSRAARMNAVAVFVNILFWGWLWSVWGMLLAVPMHGAEGGLRSRRGLQGGRRADRGLTRQPASRNADAIRSQARAESARRRAILRHCFTTARVRSTISLAAFAVTRKNGATDRTRSRSSALSASLMFSARPTASGTGFMSNASDKRQPLPGASRKP